MKTTEKNTNAIISLDGQLMVMAAHRYCLGRNSYIVSSCIDWLKLWWKDFDANTQQVIIRDTVEALQDSGGNKESFSYPEHWKQFAEWAWKELDTQQKDYVRRSVAYKQKAWPLTASE